MFFGDPYWFPHIVRGMGHMISWLEKLTRKLFPKTDRGLFSGGMALVLIVVLICTAIPLGLLALFYRVSPWLGFLLESLLCYQVLATRGLRVESMKVHASLIAEDVEGARRCVSMIVGRDTKDLDAAGIARAAVETVAENTSDGSIAPLFYLLLGGAPFGCLYKAVNTMDSMLGYKNDKYLYFGRAAAKLDDVLNYIPSRLSALLMIAAAQLCGYNAKGARRVWRRDRRKHASPNSAQTEAACAGALGVRLAGPATYFGKLHDKPYIGDDTRPVEPEDIRRAGRLLYVSAVMMLALALLFRCVIIWGLHIYGAL